MNRVTKWRHKTGVSKKIHPKGSYSHFAVAMKIAKRRFIHLVLDHHDDLIQEIKLLEIEALTKKRIVVHKKNRKRKCFGNCRDRIGILCFSRAVNQRLYDMSKRYGYYRPKNLSMYFPRKAWDWGLKEDWFYQCPAILNQNEILTLLKVKAGNKLFQESLEGSQKAIEKIRKSVWEGDYVC